ncbi:MAG: class I SAM-dependent rRNA methyltransferase [Bacteroidales bacterium]|nr:class I SAM-dependent rRNA methyltransferase [Bacteroidales bacterium]
MKKVVIQKGKEKSLQRFHPWVFSGAIAKKDKGITEGEVVEVFDAYDNFMAIGHYHTSSIAVRVFSFDKVEVNRDFWKRKIERAIAYRKMIYLFDNQDTTLFRLINGEGDEMPGLIADCYAGHLVLQFHSYGMYLMREMLVDIFKEVLADRLKSIFNKSATTLSESNAFVPSNELLYGTLDDEVLVRENGVPFYIDIQQGQKTGFFIDQRDNRKMVSEFCRGKKVLNLFCYTGGFSAYALKGGAELVHSVDISKRAIEQTNENMALLGDLARNHEAFAANVFDFIEDMPDHFYDVIVVDPPAFAKHYKVKEQGIKGYRNINRKAMEKVKPGGMIFTFSCSQAISKEDFQTIIFSAAAMEHKNVRIIKNLQHSLDHPVNIFHPEGSYLKGMALSIE